MKKRTAAEQELVDNARLLRAWHNWHAEELVEALAGPHRHVLEPLMEILQKLDPQSSRQLINFIRAQDWSAVGAQTKLVVLHEINVAITKLRERNSRPPIDDALWGEPATAFQVIRLIVIPPEGKPAAGRISGQI
jgi:hypothetical protein